jgi:hypothetical protein
MNWEERSSPAVCFRSHPQNLWVKHGVKKEHFAGDILSRMGFWLKLNELWVQSNKCRQCDNRPDFNISCFI